MMNQRPTFQDVLAAHKIIKRYLPRTPLYHYPSLSHLLGAEVYVKHENHQPIGSFKIRGGINLVSQLDEKDRKRGVITASTGNHAQSVAYASRLFGVKAVICVPNGANPGKVEATRNLGAEVIFHGKDFDDAREHVEALAEERGYRYIHSANELHLIAGVGTHTLEILEDLPDVEVLIVPVGGGSGVSGACIAAKTINPKIEVIGVGAERAPAAYLSWRNGGLVKAQMETSAEGMATRSAYELTQGIMRDMLDDYILVSEEEMGQAVVLMLEKTHNLAEEAGAASLAAALKIKDRLQGRKVVLILSGGNISLEKLKRHLEV